MYQNKWQPTKTTFKSIDSEFHTEDPGHIDLGQYSRDQIAKFIIQKYKGHGMGAIIEAILRAKGYTTYRSPKEPDKGVDIPAGYIDKSICACGMTSVALESKENIVLAVPTSYLTINKADQYPNDRCSYTVLLIWGETSSTDIDNYVSENSVQKIICTYDSLPKVKHLFPGTISKLVCL
ncbi:MAG: hypothetical protein JW894_03430 [Bacteroidales bacterium]|nr:hypothetical protein [Bacteroidales bacterium]